jgi:transforming growth factor-beta-induced protein
MSNIPSKLEDESGGSYTLFAPTNAAISALNQDNVPGSISNDVLRYHATDANLSLPIDTSVSTVEGAELDVRENTVSSDNSPPGEPGLNGALALEGGRNLKTVNGTVHLIDAVLLSRATITRRALLEPVLDSLAGAATDAGLATGTGSLNDESESFTVFAPTNAAFGAYKDTLFQDADLQETVLRSHLLSEEVSSGDIVDGQEETSDQADSDGESDDLKFNVDGSSVEVNGIPVAAADVDAKNGVVHLIGDVLLHQTTALERALVTPGFGTLVDLVQSADESVGEALNTRDGITVFAPTNAAFTAALDTNETEGLQDGEIPSGGALDSLLKYHVVDEPLRVRDVPRTQEMFPTLVGNSEGDEVGLVRSADGVVTVDPDSTNPSTVTIPDVNVDNGWIQGVDTILDNRGN